MILLELTWTWGENQTRLFEYDLVGKTDSNSRCVELLTV
jgi:hypothetical protein